MGAHRRLDRRCDDHGEAALVQKWKNGVRALTPSLLLKVIVGMHRRCHRGRFRRNWRRIWRQRFWRRFWLRRCRRSGFWIASHSDAHISLQHSITTGRECVAVSTQAASRRTFLGDSSIWSTAFVVVSRIASRAAFSVLSAGSINPVPFVEVCDSSCVICASRDRVRVFSCSREHISAG